MADSEDEIRKVISRRAAAKDTDAFVRPLADDVVNYDLAPPLAQRGVGGGG